MDTDKAIELLNEEIALLTKVSSSKEFDNWQRQAVEILSIIYGEDDQKVKNIKEIRSMYSGVVSLDIHDTAKEKAESFLKGYLKTLGIVGLISKPEEKPQTTNVYNNYVNQSQNQSQETNVNLKVVVEIMNDFLSKDQITELLEIVNSEMPNKKKEQSIVNKLIGFGENVSASILATMITNPEYSYQFAKLLGLG